MALAYGILFATLMLGLVITGGVQVPPPPPKLALPALPHLVNVVLIALGPCALAGGVVLAPSRWWVGIVGGVALGPLSGALLYLSSWPRDEITVFAPMGWVLAGYIGAIVGQCRRELRGGSASRTTGARVGVEPAAAPDQAH